MQKLYLNLLAFLLIILPLASAKGKGKGKGKRGGGRRGGGGGGGGGMAAQTDGLAAPQTNSTIAQSSPSYLRTGKYIILGDNLRIIPANNSSTESVSKSGPIKTKGPNKGMSLSSETDGNSAVNEISEAPSSGALNGSSINNLPLTSPATNSESIISNPGKTSLRINGVNYLLENNPSSSDGMSANSHGMMPPTPGMSSNSQSSRNGLHTKHSNNHGLNTVTSGGPVRGTENSSNTAETNNIGSALSSNNLNQVIHPNELGVNTDGASAELSTAETPANSSFSEFAKILYQLIYSKPRQAKNGLKRASKVKFVSS